MELKIYDREVIIQHVWKSRKLFQQGLKTQSGKHVEVLYAGTENLDSGPDFKDAVVKIAGTLLKGDIEVHLDKDGWYAHRHHQDPAYNRVVLHVISESRSKDFFVEREDGVKVEQVLIELDAATVSAYKKRERSPAYRQATKVFVEECPLSHQNEEKIISVVNAASEFRFLGKIEQLKEELRNDSWDQVLYKKIMEALGYSKNQGVFRKLAEKVPFETVYTEMQWVSDEIAEMRCAALMFGAAGLLPATQERRNKLNALSLQYVTSLLDLWDGMSRRLEIKPMKAHEWYFFRLRPQNFPTRRLAGFVQILLTTHKTGFLETFTGIVTGNQYNLTKIIPEFERKLMQRAKGFWQTHYRFEEPEPAGPGRKATFLIGRDRARDIVINILLPALYWYGVDSCSSKLRNAAIEIYRRYPRLTENVITRKMKLQLTESHDEEFKTAFASQQQGLLHLNKLYCRPMRCAECLMLDKNSALIKTIN